MLGYILTGIIGILIWQLVIFLIYWISGENEEKVVGISMGIFTVISFAIVIIINAIELTWCKHNLVAFQVKNRFKHTNFKNGSIYYTDDDVRYTTKKIKSSLQSDSQNQVKSCSNDVMYIQFLDRPIKSIPDKSQIWKGNIQFNGLDMLQFMTTTQIEMPLNRKELNNYE